MSSHWVPRPTGSRVPVTLLVGCVILGLGPRRQCQSKMANSTTSISTHKRTSGAHCMAPGCSNTYYKESNVHYHRLPTDTKRLKQWLHAMKRNHVDLPNLQHARVCSAHFLDDDYKSKGTFNTSDGSFEMVKTPDLREEACPSVLDFSTYDHTDFDCPTPRPRARPDQSKSSVGMLLIMPQY